MKSRLAALTFLAGQTAPRCARSCARREMTTPAGEGDVPGARQGIVRRGEARGPSLREEDAAVVGAFMGVGDRGRFRHCGLSFGTRGFITANQRGGTSASVSMPA